MADSQTFSVTCEALESATPLDKLEARGTVRLALKSAGLDASTVTPREMTVMLERVLPGELTTRGVDDSAAVCDRIKTSLEGLESHEDVNSPEAVFARLGG